MTRVAIHGAGGRVGTTLLRLIQADPAWQLCGAIDRPGSPIVGRDVAELVGSSRPLGVAVSDDLAQGLKDAEVVVDFSLPAGTRALLGACRARALPAVVGTTGLDAEALLALDALAAQAPVVFAANYSVGVNLLVHLAGRAAALAGEGYDVEIVEMHHRHKIDAPSGTAKRLAEAVATARGLSDDSFVYGRSGQVGARKDDEIGVMTLRGGDVVGEHTVILAGPGERLELTHRAHQREIFAAGALRAARWVSKQAPGRYDMADVLGIPR